MGCICSPGASGDFHAVYILGEKLGSGAFGQVRACRRATTGEGYAVKVLEIQDGPVGRETDARARERTRQARSEAELWRRATGHENVVRLQEVFMDNVLCYFVMERCRKSLLHALKEMEPCPVEADLLKILYDVLLALLHLHERRVVHRDIKPDNILLGGECGNVVKLCDFGLASAIPAGEHMQEVVGTPPYMSPEMLRGMTYSSKTDIWSLGVTCYVVLYGRFPYEPESNARSAKEIKAVIARGWPSPSYKAADKHPQPSELAERTARVFLERNVTRRATAAYVTGSALGDELRLAAAGIGSLTDIESRKTQHRDSSSFLEVVQAAGKMVSEFRPVSANCTKTDDLLHELQERAENNGVRQSVVKRFTLPNAVMPRMSRLSVAAPRRFTTDGALFRSRKSSRQGGWDGQQVLPVRPQQDCPAPPVLLGSRASMLSATSTVLGVPPPPNGPQFVALGHPSAVKDLTDDASPATSGSGCCDNRVDLPRELSDVQGQPPVAEAVGAKVSAALPSRKHRATVGG